MKYFKTVQGWQVISHLFGCWYHEGALTFRHRASSI